MLAFFLTLFQALRVQMGVAFTGQIIHTFLSMFTRLIFLHTTASCIICIRNNIAPSLDWWKTPKKWVSLLCISFLLHGREQLAASILQEGSAGCRVVQKFLKILQVVVQEPGQAFKPFLPSIISLCMEQVYPVVAEVSWYSLGLNYHLFFVCNQNLRRRYSLSLLLLIAIFTRCQGRDVWVVIPNTSPKLEVLLQNVSLNKCPKRALRRYHGKWGSVHSCHAGLYHTQVAKSVTST